MLRPGSSPSAVSTDSDCSITSKFSPTVHTAPLQGCDKFCMILDDGDHDDLCLSLVTVDDISCPFISVSLSSSPNTPYVTTKRLTFTYERTCHFQSYEAHSREVLSLLGRAIAAHLQRGHLTALHVVSIVATILSKINCGGFESVIRTLSVGHGVYILDWPAYGVKSKSFSMPSSPKCPMSNRCPRVFATQRRNEGWGCCFNFWPA
jgi:hypothetical protein